MAGDTGSMFKIQVIPCRPWMAGDTGSMFKIQVIPCRPWMADDTGSMFKIQVIPCRPWMAGDTGSRFLNTSHSAMQLTEHRTDRELFVRSADATRVVIVDREFRASLVLTPSGVLEDFAPRTVEEIDAAAAERVLALRPEVVLLGTGAKATFPPQAVLALFLRRGIGLETMDSAAAARTFNVLAGEGRQVAAVFLIGA